MNCQEAAEFVSALFDGEQVPGEAAEHIGGCANCGARMQEYALMSAELRRTAALTLARTGNMRQVPPRSITRVWLLGWRQTMRIPRFVVALAVFLLIAAAATGFVLVRAKEKSRWFQWTISGRDGKTIVRATTPVDSTSDPYYDIEAGMPGQEGAVWFRLRTLGQSGVAERIGARVVWVPRSASSDERTNKIANLRSLREREFLCVPKEKLFIPVEGYGNLQIEGQFQSSLPDNVRLGLYPPDDKFQILPPVILVRGDRMVAKADYGGGTYSDESSYFAFGAPTDGWYVVSTKPISGAAEGRITGNQLEFSIRGEKYFLLTGAPITFGAAKVWVGHYSRIEEADPHSGWKSTDDGTTPQLGFGQIKDLTSPDAAKH